MSEDNVFQLDDKMRKKHQESLDRKAHEARIESQEVTVESVSDKLKSLYENGFSGGEKTGWPTLDDLYTVRRGEMTILTGIPGSGKTTWLDALIVNLASKSGWKFAMFSAENLPYERHVSTMAEQFTGKPFRDGPTQRMTEIDLMAATEFLDDHMTFIMPNEQTCTVDGILSIASSIDTKRKIDGLIIDPWNEISHSRESWCSETEHISIMLTKIRRFAREANVHVWVVAHPAKLYKNDKDKYPIPTPYDISSSANWRNKADNCVTIWRDFSISGCNIEVHIQKIRFREIGKLGYADLFFNKVNCRYYENEYDCITN